MSFSVWTYLKKLRAGIVAVGAAAATPIVITTQTAAQTAGLIEAQAAAAQLVTDKAAIVNTIVTFTNADADPVAAQGKYALYGLYGGKLCWKHEMAEWYLWWSTIQSKWIVSAVMGTADSGVAYWLRASSLSGVYSAGSAHVTGNLTMAYNI